MCRRFSWLLAFCLVFSLVIPCLAVEVDDSSVDSFDLTDYYLSLGFDDDQQFEDFIFYLMDFEGVFQTDLPVYLNDGGYEFVPYDVAYDLFFYLSQASTLDIYGSWTAQGTTYYTTTTVNTNGSLRMTSPLATYSYSSTSVNTFGLACQISSLTSTVAEIAASSGGCVWTASDISTLKNNLSTIQSYLSTTSYWTYNSSLDKVESVASSGATSLSSLMSLLFKGLYEQNQKYDSNSAQRMTSLIDSLTVDFTTLFDRLTAEFSSLNDNQDTRATALNNHLTTQFTSLNSNQQTRADFLNSHLTSEFATTNTNLVGSDRSTTFSPISLIPP